jgi:protein-S-isoprenylcysteine O-methyltransferase Ste14
MTTDLLRQYGPVVFLLIFIVVTIVVRGLLFRLRTGRHPLARSGGRTAHSPEDFAEKGAAVALFLLSLWIFLRATEAETPALLGPLPWLTLPALAWFGSVLAAVGLVLTFVAQGHMGASWRIGIPEGERTELVTRGLYRFSRNPIYLGMFAALAGCFLLIPSTAVGVTALLLAAVIQVVVRQEEAFLGRLHGAAYGDYGRRVGRFLPWWGRLGPDALGGQGDRVGS